MRQKVNKKVLRRELSLILVIIMTVTGMNLDIMSESIYAAQKEKTKNKKEKITVVKELVDERTENSNTYLMSDGSKKLEIFSENIRYKDGDDLANYDASLAQLDNEDKNMLKDSADKDISEYNSVNQSGDCKQYFPNVLNSENGVVMAKDSYMVEMAPVVNETQEYVATVEKTVATYSSDYGIIEYQFESMNNGVKDYIVINEKPNVYEYVYNINTQNVELRKRKNDKGIQVLDKKSKGVVACIPAPNIIDGEGNIDYENVEYHLAKKNNQMLLTVSVNKDYFENSELKYPVKINPYMVWFDTYLTAVGVWSASFMADSTMAYSNLTVSNHLMSSYPYNSENRVFIDTSKLLTTQAFVGSGNTIADKYIESAYLSISETEKLSYYPIGTVRVGTVLEEWDSSSVTWNTQPDISEDYMAEFDSTGIEGEHHNLDITEWVQDIATGAKENHGLVLTCPEQGMAATIYGPQTHYIPDENGHSVGSRHMTISVLYRDIEKYDASVEMSAEYNGEDVTFDVTMEYNNDLNENVNIIGYKIYGRKEDESNFSVIYKGEDIDETAKILIENAEKVDLRACILYSNGIVKPSNIVSLEKTMDISEEEGNEMISVSYEQVTFDTDGDGLEDGYEIWDFKTLWNKEIGVDEEGNKTYDLDTDKDGFPDSYEVFTLGTDPAVANRYDEDGNETDSDGDGWTDFKEYQEGTDSWLKDSDFDGTNDRGDATPRKTNDYTRQTRAAEAVVHKGLYDREYSETIDGVIYTYISNIYRGDIRQISIDYGDTSLNKVMKYFYDAKGNNTAIIEAYDEAYDPNHTQTICITYTYDADNNVTFICDKRTKYTMNYGTDGQMTQLKVGNQTLMSYGDVELVNNADSDGNTTNIQIGGIIDQNEHTETYGNGQSVRTVITTYKVADDDTTSTATKTETYYNSESSPAYVTYFNADGEIIKFEDCSADSSNPVEWNYFYTEHGTSVTRSDGFTKSVQISEDEDTGASTMVTSYGFKDLNNSNQTYSSTITSQTETETDAEGVEQEKDVARQALHNNDIVSIESKDDFLEEKIHSYAYDTNVIKSTYEKEGNTGASYDVDIYAGAAHKTFDYTYDLIGNITKIELNGNVRYEYAYDAHGRVITEKDYTILKEYSYDYNTNGNIYGKTEYPINAKGNRTDSNGMTIHYTYGNSEWPDQLTTYNGQTITYDNGGNPLTYAGGMSFTWSRGRQLSAVTLGDSSSVGYRYNEDGFRTYKETDEATTTYEWDGSMLLRETVTYKTTNKRADIWYLYDANGSAIGFEYSYLNFVGTIVTARVYYEKNLQGDIIGLLDARGAEIASYAYDAWGNVTGTTYVEGNEIPYELNHILYRGYYRDDETGFYYLQSRYYDAEVGRFVNADDTDNLEIILASAIMSNLYSYCNGNPLKYVDTDGNIALADDLVIFGIGILVLFSFAYIYILNVSRQNWSSTDMRSWIARRTVLPIQKVPAFIFGAIITLAKAAKLDKKARATDIPSWARGEAPKKGESADEYANRLLDKKYGKGKWRKGPNSEHNKLKKYGNRNLGLK